MIPLSRYSERFAPSGGVGARATHRALGQHSLDFWEVFLRETIQNSWDARWTDAGPISFSVAAWMATPGQRAYLRDFVLIDPPPSLNLESALDDSDLQFLAVTDSGTRGLSGPTRADIDPSKYPGGRTDFIDFVRDTGRRADKGFEGGTYGFGKVVLCQASMVSTVVIYTRTPMGGPDGSRFIAMAIGNDEYTERSTRYTGRHWWGNVRDDVAEPLLGADADAAAFNLGMHNLIVGPTGTAILVIAPKSPDANGSESLRRIVEAIADAAAEYAWPHMITTPERRPSIDLSITLDGARVPARNPMTDQRLKTFADAFLRCEQLVTGDIEPGDTWPWYGRVVESQRPIRQLGTMAWRHQTLQVLHHDGAEPRSQIALIRNPHFVVTYRDVPKDPSGKETFGVFLAAPDLDSQYAESEPPTHDAWVPKKGQHFNPARRVLKEIPELIRQRPKVDSTTSNGVQTPSVVAIASALGILLDGRTSTGDPRVPWSPSNPRPRSTDNQIPNGTDPLPQPSTEQPVSNDRGTSSDPWPPTSAASNGCSTGTGGTSQVPEASNTSMPSTGTIPPSLNNYQYRTGRSRPLRPPVVRLDGQPTLRTYDGQVVAEFPFTLHVTQGLVSITVSAQPSVFVDGGKESEAPLGAEMPTVVAWYEHTSGNVFAGSTLTVSQPFSSNWSVLVSQPSDAAVSVDLSIAGHQ
jgi:hypothetical protein